MIRSAIRTVAAAAALAAGTGVTLLASPGVATAVTDTNGCSSSIAIKCNTVDFGTAVVGKPASAPITITNDTNQAVYVADWGPDYGDGGVQEYFPLADGGCPGAVIHYKTTWSGATYTTAPIDGATPTAELQPGQSCTATMTVTPTPQGTTPIASMPQPISFQDELVVLGADGTTSHFPTVYNVIALETSGTPVPAPVQPAGGCSAVLAAGSVVGTADSAGNLGYWIAGRDGQVVNCGDAPALGDAMGEGMAAAGIAAIAATPDGKGYYLVSTTGQVYAFGDAKNQGDVNFPLAKPIVAMAVDPATGGYWLLGGDGGVFSYNAPFYGSTGNIALAKPAVGMESTANGRGYYFVASDGGVFAYGDAPYHGSVPGVLPHGAQLNKPVVGMALDPATGGYWMDASDGGIFSFDAPFYGSTGNVHLAQPCVGMTASPNGAGYRFVAADGGIFDFGNSHYYGSAA